jgi:predicted ATPase
LRSDETLSEASYKSGAGPSIVESFAIDGLHGFLSISFASKRAATVLIARNGSGKTTLMGALDAFLKRQFFRLKDLQFDKMTCKLSTVGDELVVTRNDIESILAVPNDLELNRLSQKTEISERVIYQFIVGEWNFSRKNLAWLDNDVFRKLVRAMDYDHSKTADWLDKAASRFLEKSPGLKNTLSKLDDALGDFEIVYLPTYRRIELALERDDAGLGSRRRPPALMLAGSLFTGDMQFGLSDIADRLRELNHQIVAESGFGYRKLSANIINDLLDGQIEQQSEKEKSRPSTDDLKLFFSRLEASKRTGPYYMDKLPDLEKLERDDFTKGESGRFLLYFLDQLRKVIDSTKEKELLVDQFVSSCNKYLSSEHDTADGFSEQGSKASYRVGEKVLKLNRADLSVLVETKYGDRKIPLDSLSSGEKQMISLFAKLYLYPRDKIVLIDEPELSLSIDWQRSILVDILKAPLCRQVVAITHSPFVFDNELEPYARSIKVTSIGSAQKVPEADEK